MKNAERREIPNFDGKINAQLRPAAIEHFAAKGAESQGWTNKVEPEPPFGAPRLATMEHSSPGATSTSTGEIITEEVVDLMEAEDVVVLHSKTQQLLDQAVHHRHGRVVPIAVAYFTKKAEEDKARRLAEARELFLANMSDAHRHFNPEAVEMIEHQIEIAMVVNASRGCDSHVQCPSHRMHRRRNSWS